MAKDTTHSKLYKRAKAVKALLGKEKVGLPVEVSFQYQKGTVDCYPKERKWVISLSDGRTFTQFITKGRNDVTKYKARLFLKCCLSGLWKPDKS